MSSADSSGDRSSPPDADGWTQVRSKRCRAHPKVRLCKKYWNGFDRNGERWFIELSDGRVLAPSDKEYYHWQHRHN